MAHKGFGERIEQAILFYASQKGSRVTLKAFGREVGIRDRGRGYTTSAVSEWIQERAEPGIRTFRVMAAITGRPVEWLMALDSDLEEIVPPADPAKDAATFERWTQRGKEIAAERDATARPASKRVVGLRPTTPTRRGKPRK